MSGSTASPCPALANPSPVPAGLRSLRQEARSRLEQHEAVWRSRPLLREIYRGYHDKIDRAKSRVAGLDVEIGAGHGSFAGSRPQTIACDIIPCPWLDCAADAARLPFRDESIANIIMIDVLHHVANTVAFFSEVERTLTRGGRLVLIEPYVSPVSWLAWRFLHDERIDTAARPLEDVAEDGSISAEDPWDANTAIPTLLFWRDLAAFTARFPLLQAIHRERFDTLLYPVSGGFERRRLVPMSMVPLVRMIERLTAPLAPILAFRCLVVLEKKLAE